MEKMTMIPHYLKADDVDSLKKEMLKNNITDGYYYRYFDIREIKGKWYAWYVKDVEKTAILKESMSGNDRR